MKEMHHICVAKMADTYVGFDVQSVRSVYEVSDLLTIPIPLPNVLGVFNQRGKVLSVIDGPAFCKMAMANTGSYRTLLHLETNGGECCLTVDSVEEVKEVNKDDLRGPPAGLNSAMKSYCTQVLLDNENKTILILDFLKMFTALSAETPSASA